MPTDEPLYLSQDWDDTAELFAFLMRLELPIDTRPGGTGPSVLVSRAGSRYFRGGDDADEAAAVLPAVWPEPPDST